MATVNIPNPAAVAGQAASNHDDFVPFPQLITGDEPALVAEVETAGAATTFAAFTVVGRITATGLIVASVPGAADGSEDPIGITVTAKAATAGDEDVEVYVAGVFNPEALTYDAGFATVEDLRLAFKTAAPMVFLKTPTVG